MSGETEKDISGWTVDTLHSLMVQRFDELERRLSERANAQEKAFASALAAAEKAVTKAEAASEKRFESVNEFRQTLSDQAVTFLTRTEYEANHRALVSRVSDLTDRINITQGKSVGTTTTFGVLLAVATIVISIVVVFINVITNK